VNYLLSTNFAEILIIFISGLMGLPLPLIAIQILWINLITDGLPALAL
jgi:Ca2+-transporting ATPase